MKKILCIFTILLLACCGTVFADNTDDNRRDVERLLILMGSPKIMEQFTNQLKQIYSKQVEQTDMSEELKPLLKKQNSELLDLLTRELSWEKIKDDYIDVYLSVYTIDEIKELIKFYESPIGKKMVEKTPYLINSMLELSQQKVWKLTPQINALVEKHQKELRDLTEKTPIS
ncbi:MAG: DUF2059 domain-containing protein [Deferribacteres bacterium]|nr:DUF2059 domain-containing protein [Deferribacteres bacterium]